MKPVSFILLKIKKEITYVKTKINIKTYNFAKFKKKNLVNFYLFVL